MSNKFFRKSKDGKVEINRYDLVKFYEENGFYKLVSNGHRLGFVKIENNIVSNCDKSDLVVFTRKYLESINRTDVLEHFLNHGEITNNLIEFFDSKQANFLKDSVNSSYFYFRNGVVKVDKEKLVLLDYNNLDGIVWKNKIIDFDISLNDTKRDNDFRRFLFNISGKYRARYKSLLTGIGYMLHSYKDRSNSRALVLLDSNFNGGSDANGGTGKSVIGNAISQLRNVKKFDGKTIKSNSQFKNQQVDLDTDILYYDDVQKGFSFEDLYSDITDGITVEKKFETAYTLSFEDSPKILISSNYMLNGNHGNSDRRRKIEYEVSDYYLNNPTPVEEFGKRFFDEWNEKEWNSFYLFFMNCCRLYFGFGVVFANEINLVKNKIVQETSNEFYEFITNNLTAGRHEHRELLDRFNYEYGFHYSAHQFTKYLKKYGKIAGIDIEVKGTSGKNRIYVYD